MKYRPGTVEPIFGTLTHFVGLRKVNSIGSKQANTCMQLAAIAYNIKKHINFQCFQRYKSRKPLNSVLLSESYKP
ncbi:transposase [Leeuwenhoekiella sp. H156]|uniref:transposase n=1 Tax=Leeuwenhoekiella sp. H156 TaxID=3450128 RepID=UPI003FA49492